MQPDMVCMTADEYRPGMMHGLYAAHACAEERIDHRRRKTKVHIDKRGELWYHFIRSDVGV